LLLLFFSVSALTQKTEVRAVIDQYRILIGERIALDLEVSIPETEPIRFFSLDSIPHFEFIEFQKPDTSDIDDGTRIRQRILLTSFDSGSFVIPSFSLIPGEGPFTDSFSVEVAYSPMDTSQAYHDVRDVLDEELEPVQKVFEWYYLAIGIGLVLLLLFLFLRRQKKPVLAEKPIDIFQETMDGLKKTSVQELDAKNYCQTLTDLFRVYLQHRLNIHSADKTTEPLIRQLKENGFKGDRLENLSAGLQMADTVKFAKYAPIATELENFRNMLIETVRGLEEGISKNGTNA